LADIPFNRLGIPGEHQEKVKPEAPAKIKLAVAKGLLPIPPRALVPMAYVLLGDKNAKVSDAARRTLIEMPVSTLTSALSTSTHPKILEFLGEFRSEEASLMEVLYRNREANDRTCILIAESAKGDLLDMVIRNQERLLITPEVYLALKRNPEAPQNELDRIAAFLRMNRMLPEEPEEGTAPAAAPKASASKPAVKRLSAQEEEERKQRLLQAEIEAALLGLPSPATNPEVREKLDMFNLDDLEPVQDAEGADSAGLGGFVFDFNETGFSFNLTDTSTDGTVLDDEAKLNIVQKINEMNIGHKIKLAYKGNAEVRKILIRDRNKMVACAVLKSGRMSDGELLSAAGNRNLEGEVIRELCRSKEAMRKYPIKVALVNNPKTPVSIAIGIVNILQKRDLQALARNKNIAGAVNTMALRKVRAQRNKSG